jgi:hypothetical protein
MLKGTDPADLEWEIAAFLHHLPAIAEVIRAERLNEPNALASLTSLTLNEDGLLEMAWMDRKELKEHRRVLHLPKPENQILMNLASARPGAAVEKRSTIRQR